MASRTIIGIDTHIVNSNYFCLKEKSSEILGVGSFETNTTNFIKAVERFPKPRIVIIEQGSLADWIMRILEKYVEEVIVADTQRNSWIAKDPLKSDRMDAEKLVHLYLGGYIKRIVPRSKQKQELISLVIHYHSLTKQGTRLKNMIGAKFRQCGKRKRGKSAYIEERIESEMGYLSKNKGLEMSVRNYREQLKVVEKQKERVTQRIQKLSCNYPEIAFLNSFSGIGFVGSATLSALIDVPERFSTVKKLWIYCGYGLDCPSSGGRQKRWRITKRGNRYLKNIIGTAVHIIAHNCKNNNRYKAWYDENLQKGKDNSKLKAILARKLIKDIWIGWRAFNRSAVKQAA